MYHELVRKFGSKEIIFDCRKLVCKMVSDERKIFKNFGQVKQLFGSFGLGEEKKSGSPWHF